MKLGAHPSLDALCGEYLLGSLRGAARRRFERALAQDPLVALRLAYWQRTMAVPYTEKMQIQPAAGGWQRLQRELGLKRPAQRWLDRVELWRGWALVATAVLLVTLGVQVWRSGPTTPQFATIALLEASGGHANVTAQISSDHRQLALSVARPVLASAQQSFELWLIPAQGGAPVSLGVVGSLDARIDLRTPAAAGIVPGAKLAVSVEPAGGSPTGGPTGAVIAIGAITS